MESTGKNKRRKERRPAGTPQVLRLEVKDRLGHTRWITADLVDLSETGIAIALVAPLQAGGVLRLRGKIGQTDSIVQARVVWCLERTDGMFRAGLEFVDGADSGFGKGEAQSNPRADDSSELDCYEAMQLSPNADSETIRRVYRILAQRYHPDNTATGDGDLFVQLSNAYRILSDPAQRAAYDVRHQQAKQLKWKIFDQASTASGVEGEKRKRVGILALLYSKMLRTPDHPSLTIHELEDLLGCPREHLQASIWFLKGKGYIQRSDNGRFTITVEGFEAAEEKDVIPTSAPMLVGSGPSGDRCDRDGRE